MKLLYFPIKPFYRTVYEILYDMYFLLRSYRICDYVYVLGILSSPIFFTSKLFGKKVIVNPDGLEWKRDKFNGFLKAILYFQGICAIWFADVIVADSSNIKKIMELKGGKNVRFIPYGIEPPEPVSWSEEKLRSNASLNGLRQDGYYLIVARLEPENNIHVLVEGYLKSHTDKELVIVGDFISDKYSERVHRLIQTNGSHRVIFAGSIYDITILNMLRQHCFAYFHGHSVGGTNPSLLEAMAMKNIIVAHANPFNQEVGEGSLLYFTDADDLARTIKRLEADYGVCEGLKLAAFDRVTRNYSWDRITNEYVSLLNDL